MGGVSVVSYPVVGSSLQACFFGCHLSGGCLSGNEPPVVCPFGGFSWGFVYNIKSRDRVLGPLSRSKVTDEKCTRNDRIEDPRYLCTTSFEPYQSFG